MDHITTSCTTKLSIIIKYDTTHSTFTCSTSTMKTPGQCVKYVQSWHQRQKDDANEAVLLSLLPTLDRFHILF